MNEVIGILGLGRMGLPLCASAVRAGYPVVASDVRPHLEHEIRRFGADWAADETEAGAAADVLITVLPGSEELETAMTVALPAMRGGSTWIDMTSSSPPVGDALAGRAGELGIDCLDSPMGGGVDAAHGGALQLFVGGPAELVERHRRLLEVFGTIEHVGGPGAGRSTKLLVNLLWFGQAVASAEALLLAEKAGMDVEVVRAVVGRSAAANAFLRHDLDALLEGDYIESFGVDRCCEELDAAVALAGRLGVPAEFSTLVAWTYGRALARYGPVGGELLAVRVLEEEAGVDLRRPRRG